MGLQKQKLIRFKLQFNNVDGYVELPLGYDYQSFITAARNAFGISPDHPIFFFLLNNYQTPETLKRLEFSETLYTNLLFHCSSSPDLSNPNFMIEITDFSEFQFGDFQSYPDIQQSP